MRSFNFLKSEYFIVVSIILVSLFLSFIPTIHHFLKTPSDTVYTMAYNFYPDYYQFISWMKDGEGGHLALTSRFTPEIFPRKYGHTFFSVFGFLSSFFTKDYFAVFTLGRLLFGFFRLALVYAFISFVIKRRGTRIAAFLCIIFLSSFYQIGQGENGLEVRYFLPGITNFDFLRRLTFLPHHLFATILMIGVLIFYGLGLLRKRIIYSSVAAILLFMSSLVNPATVLSMGSTLLFSLVVFFFFIYPQRKSEVLVHFAIVISGIVTAIIFLKYYLFTVFPWDLFYTNDVSKLRWPFFHYIGVLGWALPLAILGLISGKKYYKNIFFVLTASWGFAPIFAIFLSSYFPQISMFRLFQAQQAIPLGILSGIGLVALYKRLGNYRVFILCLIVFLTSLPYIKTSIDEQLGDAPLNNYYIYLPKGTYETFRFLDTRTTYESVVLAGYYSGQMLPAFSHNRVLVGHVDGTYEYNNKLDIMTKFYSGNFTGEELDKIVRDNRISYFFFGPDAPPPQNTSLKNYAKAKLIYENRGNYVYEVIK